MTGPAQGVALSPGGRGRVVPLDALRGLAVIGIIFMNVFAFAMPGAAYYNPRAWGGTGLADLALWTASFLFIEDKFRTLFAMMFGVGVAILLGRKGDGGLRAHYSRMAVLFVIGAIHATLLFSGDVLRLYALAGLVLPICAFWPARRLWIAACILMAVYMAVGGYIAFGWTEYWWRTVSLPGTDPAPLARAEMAFGADPATLERGLAMGREPLMERIERRLSSPAASLIAAGVVMPVTLAAMLAGMALWRSGLLAGQWPPARAFRLAGWMAAISLPVLGLLAWLAHFSGFNGAVIGTNALVWSAPFDLLLGIGWAGLAMGLFVRAGADAGWVRRLAAAGRLALTNYLATSVMLGAIFHSWGFGLFGELGRVETCAITLVPAAAMLAWSPLWLGHFRQGPAEWFWRSAARLRRMPLRR